LKTGVENRLLHPVFGLTKALAMNRTFPPTFTLWVAKTGHFFSVTANLKVKTA
jgi:hypothetical protein